MDYKEWLKKYERKERIKEIIIACVVLLIVFILDLTIKK